MKYLCSCKQIFFFALTLNFILINYCSAQESKFEPIPLTFKNNGSRISAKFFKASETKFCPTVILVQGYPGNENDVLGIGAYLKEHDINAIMFNYRGSYKSEGLFSIENAVSDVVNAVEFVKNPETVLKYNIDTTNIAVAGYSLGSAIVIMSSDKCPAVSKFIIMAPTNLKLTAQKIESDSLYRKNHLNALKAGSQFINSKMSPEKTHQWMIEHKSYLDLLNTVDVLSNRKVLMLGGWNDSLAPVEENLFPVYRALQKRSAECRLILYESGHTLKNVLPGMYSDISDWLKR